MSVLRRLMELSLTHGVLHETLIVGALLGLAALLLLLRRQGRWWTLGVPAAMAVAALLVAAVWLWVDIAKPWPDGLPPAVLAWIGLGLLGPILAVVGWRRQRWATRILAAAGALLVVLGAADGIDTFFGAYPTLATALHLAPYDSVSASRVLNGGNASSYVGEPLWQSWHPPSALPPHGVVINVQIPPTRSGFAARTAWVYLPPAYLTASRPALPVLMMIGGQPGSPRDWLDGGQLAQQMDGWAAAHRGLAPVVVMPDALGGLTANPLCMDSRLGRADTYLAVDVPAWVLSHLGVDADTGHWAVGGFSYGGTCALQLAVAHPALFRTFFDASGQQAPTLGGYQRTVNAAFGGDRAAFAAVNPLDELRARRYSGSAGYLVVGAQDSVYRPQALVVAAATREAGMSIVFTELPGEHSWAVWRPALGKALPWLASRMGLAQ